MHCRLRCDFCDNGGDTRRASASPCRFAVFASTHGVVVRSRAFSGLLPCFHQKAWQVELQATESLLLIVIVLDISHPLIRTMSNLCCMCSISSRLVTV